MPNQKVYLTKRNNGIYYLGWREGKQFVGKPYWCRIKIFSILFGLIGLFDYIGSMNQKHDKSEAIKNGLDLFCSKGYSSVGLDEICQTTGMTKGSFYNAFKSKEQFLLETIDLFNKSNTARINTELAPKRRVKAIQQLKRFYARMLAVQPKTNFMGCMVNNMMSELGANNDKVANVTAEGFEKIINAIEPAVQQAQKEGDIDQTYASKEIASLLHTTFYGVLTRAKSLGSIKPGIKTMNQLFNHLQPKNI